MPPWPCRPGRRRPYRRTRPDRDEAARVSVVFDGNLIPLPPEFAEEATASCSSPMPLDIERMTATSVSKHHPSSTAITTKIRSAAVLSPTACRLPPNLREALLDQPAYSELIPKEDAQHAQRAFSAEMRPDPYDDETLYRHQMAHTYRDLQMFGIPKDEYDPPRIDSIFIKARADRKPEPTTSDPAQPNREPRGTPAPKCPCFLRGPRRRTAAASSSAILARARPHSSRFLAYICAVAMSRPIPTSQPPRHSAPTDLCFTPGYVAQAEEQSNAYSLLDYVYTEATGTHASISPATSSESALESGGVSSCSTAWTRSPRTPNVVTQGQRIRQPLSHQSHLRLIARLRLRMPFHYLQTTGPTTRCFIRRNRDTRLRHTLVHLPRTRRRSA